MTEIEKINEKLFMLQMQDVWTAEDYKYEDELLEQLKNIKREQKNMKIKVYVGLENIDENYVKVVRVEEEKAFKYAMNKLNLTMKKDNNYNKKQVEFADRLVKWYFKNWNTEWEDVD